jgi:hypothetical protein
MTEPRAAEPVDPDCLLQAFLIIADGSVPDDSNEPMRMTQADAGRLLNRIATETGTSPQMAFDLFRRSCAMANFFSVPSNRELISIDETKPRPAVWVAAAVAPVHQVIVDQLACDTYDPREFRDAVRRYGG